MLETLYGQTAAALYDNGCPARTPPHHFPLPAPPPTPARRLLQLPLHDGLHHLHLLTARTSINTNTNALHQALPGGSLALKTDLTDHSHEYQRSIVCVPVRQVLHQRLFAAWRELGELSRVIRAWRVASAGRAGETVTSTDTGSCIGRHMNRRQGHVKRIGTRTRKEDRDKDTERGPGHGQG